MTLLPTRAAKSACMAHTPPFLRMLSSVYGLSLSLQTCSGFAASPCRRRSPDRSSRSSAAWRDSSSPTIVLVKRRSVVDHVDQELPRERLKSIDCFLAADLFLTVDEVLETLDRREFKITARQDAFRCASDGGDSRTRRGHRPTRWHGQSPGSGTLQHLPAIASRGRGIS